jgi:zinc protease
MAQTPEPGRVVASSEIPTLGITHWTLSNGIEIYLKPTDFKNDQVLFSAFSPGGHSLVADSDYVSATFADAIVGEGGLGAFDQIELEKALAGKQVSLSAYIGELEEGISGGASPQDMETLLTILHLQVTAPREDKKAVSSYLTKLRALVANRLASPGAVFQDALRQALYGDHPRRRVMSSELLDEIDPHRSMEIFRQRFADFSDFTFIFVGNLDLDSLRPLVETYLGSLPATEREESWRNIGLPRLDQAKTVRVRKGLEPRSQVHLSFSGPVAWSREGRYVLGTLAEVLELRLREVLREEKGAVYQVGVSASMRSAPEGRYGLSISFGCAPEKVDELVENVLAEIRSAQEKGFDPELLTKTQEAQLRSHELSLKRNGFWLGALNNYLSHDLDPELILDYEAMLQSTNADTLQAAAQLYFDFERTLLGILDPEVATAAPAED